MTSSTASRGDVIEYPFEFHITGEKGTDALWKYKGVFFSRAAYSIRDLKMSYENLKDHLSHYVSQICRPRILAKELLGMQFFMMNAQSKAPLKTDRDFTCLFEDSEVSIPIEVVIEGLRLGDGGFLTLEASFKSSNARARALQRINE